MKEGGGVGEGEETREGERERERRERASGCEEWKKRMGESGGLVKECECEWGEGSARSSSGRRLVWEKLRSKTRSTLFLTRVLVVRRGDEEGPPMGKRGSLLCFTALRGTSGS